jgi:hypothetical protein
MEKIEHYLLDQLIFDINLNKIFGIGKKPKTKSVTNTLSVK